MKTNDLLKFPEELKRSERWVLWKYVKRGEKTTKLPYQPNSQPAESNNPRTWSTFDVVLDASSSKQFEGVGCMISEPYIAVDFDHVRDPKTGEVELWALEALKYLNTYTEMSPSGTGFHAWGYGKVPGAGKRKGRVELYASGRYFTVTGEHLDNYPATVNEIPQDFYTRIETLDPQYKSSIPSEIKNERITSSQKFFYLQQGDWKSAGYPSQSEADCAYCVKLAEVFNGDIQQIDAAFRVSKLFRDKWDVRHGPDTYGNMTIAKALVNFKKKKHRIHSGKIVSLDSITPEVITWLWPNKVPLGKVTLFSGPPGIGKTCITDDLIARITRGEFGKPASCLIMAAEDDAADTIVPRLLAMKANLKLVQSWTQTTVIESDSEYDRAPALDSDIDIMKNWITSNPDAQLIVIDPISNYLGKANMNREQEVRSVLMPLVLIASEFKIAIIIIGHFNKMKDGEAITRQQGATALTGVPRVVWNFTQSAESTDERIMASPKMQHLKALRYKIIGSEVTLPSGKITEVGIVEWLGETTITAEETLQELSDPDKTKKLSAKSWLLEQLSDGKEHEATVLVRTGSNTLGISEATIRRAAEKIQLIRRKDETIKHKEFWKVALGETADLF